MCVLVVVLLVSIGGAAVQANPGLNIVAVYALDGGDLYINDVKLKLEGTGLFNTVDAYDTTISIPSLAELQNYDAVLVYSNWIYDGTAMGNVLADYMDSGGGVVLACLRGAAARDRGGEEPLREPLQRQAKDIRVGKQVIQERLHRL